MQGFRRKPQVPIGASDAPIEPTNSSKNIQHVKEHDHAHLPRFNHNGHKVTRGIHPDGESGRKGVHPWHFLRICFRSTSTASKVVNVLWPVVPAAIAIHFARPDLPLWVFALNYIAMIPAANLVGFAGQELARKLPRVVGTAEPSPRVFLPSLRVVQVFSSRRSSAALLRLCCLWSYCTTA